MKHLNSADLARLAQSLKALNTVEAKLLTILIETGCRTMELLNIRQGDIGADSVSIRALKGSVSTVKRLSPESVEFLKTLTASSPGLELWRLVRPYSRAGVRKRLQLLNYSMTLRLVGQRMNLHSLRHSWAVLGYQASGGNIIGLQAAMGHRSISSTARYLHYLKGQEISHEVFNIVNNFGKVGS